MKNKIIKKILKYAIGKEILNSLILQQYIRNKQEEELKQEAIKNQILLKEKIAYDYENILRNKLLSYVIPEVAASKTILPTALNLGVPIGPTSFTDNIIQKKIAEYLLNQAFMSDKMNITPEMMELVSQLSYINFLKALKTPNISPQDLISAANTFDSRDEYLANKPLVY